MERVMGIEPTRPAWKAGILPLNYTRIEDVTTSTWVLYHIFFLLSIEKNKKIIFFEFLVCLYGHHYLSHPEMN